jgi:hypothetical protein
LAEQICNNFDCGCLGDIKSGSIAPDKVFRDFRDHHYYNPSICTPSSYYTCPTYYDDIALEKADYWLDRARSDSGCDMWYDIGVASHYFFDSKAIWHQVRDEDYNECHKPFETEVGDKFKYGYTDWSVCRCEECVSYSDFFPWISEFEQKLGFVSQYPVPTITPTPTPSCRRGECEDITDYWFGIGKVCRVEKCSCIDCSTYYECWSVWTGIDCKPEFGKRCRDIYGTEYADSSAWVVYKIDTTKDTKEKCEPTLAPTVIKPIPTPEQLCVPNSTRCSESSKLVERCSSTGRMWLPSKYCKYGCEEGECIQPSPTPTPTTPTPTLSPTPPYYIITPIAPTPKQPAFEIIFAVVSIFVIVYLIRRRKG